MSTTPILDPLRHELERLYAEAERAERLAEYVNKLSECIARVRAQLHDPCNLTGTVMNLAHAVLAALEGAPVPETKPCDWSYRILNSKFPCCLPYGHSGAHLYGSGAAGEWTQNQV